MAETNGSGKKIVTKSAHAEREERILASWKEKAIFEKTLNKKAPKGEFVFYEGPPTANGRPGIHHLEARAFKDAIPRYKTMRGYHVRRKGGWDTHGLPVELQVEKELGLKSKKEIETYGIAAFNERCKASVWTYVHEWERFTDRLGYWVDLQHPYVTYKPAYIEALWNIVETVHKKDLLYKDYKVVPWCPRCGTALSSHELAQGYENVKDLSVTVKFEIRNPKFEGKTYLLAWTTTPWTLPGNVGLAVGSHIEYVNVKTDQGILILAKDRLTAVFKDQKYETIGTVKGKELVGLEYEPLYSFLKDNVSGPEKDKLANAYKVYAADFVTTADGTGIVHTAVMYGQDDFELGTAVGLPKYHLVNEDGTFKKEAGFLAGKFVKDEATDVEIIKDLAHRGLLFAKEKYEHSYPFCWRCHTPLIYFARDSWYIRMSDLRHKLVKENEGIHWEPEHIKEGRFGEWLREVKDWAISRERYWGTPLPVWVCERCKKWKVAGSVADVSRKPRNTYYVMRHGEAENNVKGILNGKDRNSSHLTEKGRKDVLDSSEALRGVRIDLVFTSPFARARETADIVRNRFGWKDDQVTVDERLHEVDFGENEGMAKAEFSDKFSWTQRFEKMPDGGEKYGQIKKRMGDFLYDMEEKHEGKTILIVTHGTPAMMLLSAALGLDRQQSTQLEIDRYIHKANVRKVEFSVLPHNPEYELDLHRPYIDQVKLPCSCGGEMSRVKEVMDVWFDSGSMPFAQDHVLGERVKSKGLLQKMPNYPADYISEAIDQTRGWFYTLHAIGALMGAGKAFKNVICLGHILDAEGKKMSKSIGNVVDPWEMMDMYGADALRLWMYSVNQPGDSKNFDPKTVDEINKKVFNLAANVLSFYQLYADKASPSLPAGGLHPSPSHVLDRWVIARLSQLVRTVTDGLDGYQFFEPVRSMRDFIGDLSQWYLRRSRDRFKGDHGADKQAALATTRFVLLSLAKVMAPFAPFFAEHLYAGAGGEKESVHLEDWPEAGKVDEELVKAMETARAVASKGLEARMAAKINVRQPLARLKIKNEKARGGLFSELVDLVKDEVNVEEIAFAASIEKDVELDTTITPDLKEKGEVRELLRKIQDLRKEKGLTVSDVAKLTVPADIWPLAQKFEAILEKATNLSDIAVGDVLSLDRA